MGTEILKSFEILQEELERAKDTLKGVDENIKRLIGRDPNEGPTRPPATRISSGQPEDFRGRPPARRWAASEDHGNGEQPTPKRTRDGFYNRPNFPEESARMMPDPDSADEEEFSSRPAVASRVIATPRDTKSRQEVLAAQSADSQSKARNRRMFGALLGTLQKFQQEETRMRDKEEKRARVEKKLEDAARREREELRRERQELFLDRKRKQAEIRKIELKILRIKEQDEWEAKHRYLLNFIQTRTKPHIFYLPKIPCARSEERLLASQKAVARMIEKKREDVHAELGAIEKRAQWRQGLVDAGEDGRRGWGGGPMGMGGGARGLAAVRRGRKRLRLSVGSRLQMAEAKEEGEVGEEDDDFEGAMDDDFEAMDEDDDDILGTIPSVASTVIRPGIGEAMQAVVESLTQRGSKADSVEETVTVSMETEPSLAVPNAIENASEEVVMLTETEGLHVTVKREETEVVELAKPEEEDNGTVQEVEEREVKEEQNADEDSQPVFD